MKRVHRRFLGWGACALLVAALAIVAAGCGGDSKKSTSTKTGPNLPTSIGPGEGKLSLIAWEGYTQPQWVKPFEKQTGCKVSSKYGGSSDEMVTLMRQGGGQYDMVSASGDASLRLIRGGDVRAMNPDLIPDFDNFIEALKAPPHNTIDGVHYGISLQWGPNTLLYNTTKVKPAPTSWGALYDPKYKGQITIPDNAIQIADAALYLMKTKSDLGITDPYELTQPQFDAAVKLLKKQRPLLKKHWSLASDEIDLFKNGDATIGASWPYQTNTLVADKVPVKDLIPAEGATGWADTWMLSSKSKHPNCAYLWTKWVSTPKVQAQQAIYFGETPANTKACAIMDQLSPDSCKQYHADAPASYFDSIKFWKTPSADCGNGEQNCMDYNRWQQAWTEIKG
jgi:putative spermidine/putrescine transport system substrate-binding protein